MSDEAIAVIAGENAANAGEPYSENPYPLQSMRGDAWDFGWKEQTRRNKEHMAWMKRFRVAQRSYRAVKKEAADADRA